MKFIEVSKDGGPESRVWAYWLVEIKSLFSIALLKFENGSRDAYHNHAFNSISWVLKGRLVEEDLDLKNDRIALGRFDDHKFYTKIHVPSFVPVVTWRTTNHKVTSHGSTWVLTFRGPWSRTWKESVNDGNGGYVERTLTHGRKIINGSR